MDIYIRSGNKPCCRACLRQSVHQMYSLALQSVRVDDNSATKVEEIELADIYNQCTQLTYDQSDSQWEWICSDCFQKLVEFFKFRAMCIDSYRKLKNYVPVAEGKSADTPVGLKVEIVDVAHILEPSDDKFASDDEHFGDAEDEESITTENRHGENDTEIETFETYVKQRESPNITMDDDMEMPQDDMNEDTDDNRDNDFEDENKNEQPLKTAMSPRNKTSASKDMDFNVLLKAIKRCLVEKLPIRSTAAAHTIPRTTFQRYLKRVTAAFDDIEAVEDAVLFDFLRESSQRVPSNQVFSPAQEKELVSQILKNCNEDNRLNVNKLRELAYEFAEKLQIEFPDGWAMECRAGIEWYRKFLNRHPELGLHSREQTSLNHEPIEYKKVPSRPKTKPSTKTTNDVFACEKCPRKFFKRLRYETHLRTHLGLKPWQCDQCEKSFIKLDTLKRHLATIHYDEAEGKPEFICGINECGKSCTTKDLLKSHFRRFHGIGKKVEPSPRKICEQCGKSFANSFALKEHSYTHSKLTPYKCPICEKMFSTKWKLKEHQLRHKGIKNFVCPTCGLRKITNRELQTHMKLHSDVTFPCDLCSSKFRQMPNLKRHKRIVHCGIKAYPCTHCDRSFGKAETLKHHIMTHTGEKPHACLVCDKRFIQVVALKKHMKVHKK